MYYKGRPCVERVTKDNDAISKEELVDLMFNNKIMSRAAAKGKTKAELCALLVDNDIVGSMAEELRKIGKKHDIYGKNSTEICTMIYLNKVLDPSKEKFTRHELVQKIVDSGLSATNAAKLSTKEIADALKLDYETESDEEESEGEEEKVELKSIIKKPVEAPKKQPEVRRNERKVTFKRPGVTQEYLDMFSREAVYPKMPLYYDGERTKPSKFPGQTEEEKLLKIRQAFAGKIKRYATMKEFEQKDLYSEIGRAFLESKIHGDKVKDFVETYVKNSNVNVYV